jgi:hypothetical protein
MMEFISWDDYSQYMENVIKDVPNHQPGNTRKQLIMDVLLVGD